MRIDNEFTVHVPIQRAWEALTDLEGVAPCLPGAVLTGVEGDVYRGKVKIKVGPVVSEYAGTAQLVEKDEAARRAVIDAKGRDSRGAGNASAVIEARLREDGAATVVAVSTELQISGKIAQFGSGMIKEVSEKLLGQFVANLESRLLAPVLAEAPGAPAAPPAGLAAQARPPGGSEGTPAADGTAPGHLAGSTSGEVEPLDLMSIAGSSVYRRVAALVVAAVVVGIVVYVVAR